MVAPGMLLHCLFFINSKSCELRHCPIIQKQVFGPRLDLFVFRNPGMSCGAKQSLHFSLSMTIILTR
jgi:hypothetical protein